MFSGNHPQSSMYVDFFFFFFRQDPSWFPFGAGCKWAETSSSSDFVISLVPGGWSLRERPSRTLSLIQCLFTSWKVCELQHGIMLDGIATIYMHCIFSQWTVTFHVSNIDTVLLLIRSSFFVFFSFCSEGLGKTTLRNVVCFWSAKNDNKSWNGKNVFKFFNIECL